MKRFSAFLLILMLLLAPAALAEYAQDGAGQALQDQAASNPGGPQIAYAGFTQAEAYVSPAETIRLTASLSGLTVGDTYKLSAILTDGRGGYVASGAPQPSAETEFIAEYEGQEVTLVFTLDTTTCPGQHWIPSLVLSTWDGQVLSQYKGNGSIEVVAPVMQAEVTQGDNQGTLVVSFAVSVSNIQAGTEYELTGSLVKDASDGPFRIGGAPLTASTSLVMTQDDLQFHLPASGEVTIQVPMASVQRTTLYPVITLSQNGTVIAQNRSGSLYLGATPTWNPAMGGGAGYTDENGETQEGRVSYLGTDGDTELTPEPSETASVSPDVSGEPASDITAGADASAPAPVSDAHTRMAQAQAGLDKFIIGMAVAGACVVAGFFIYRRYKQNSQPW